MTLFLLALASFIPGILWVWFFYRQDREQPEPKGLVIRAFLYGMLSTLPAAMMESLFQGSLQNPASLISLLFVTIFGVGLVEEGAKFLAVYFAVGREREFDQVLDGIIYAVAAALGFAALENFFYARLFGWSVIPVRALLTPLAHASFSGLVGYHLGLAKVRYHSYPVELWKGLTLAMVLHGIYDWLVIGKILPSWVFVLFFLWVYRTLWGKIKQARRDDELV